MRQGLHKLRVPRKQGTDFHYLKFKLAHGFQIIPDFCLIPITLKTVKSCLKRSMHFTKLVFYSIIIIAWAMVDFAPFIIIGNLTHIFSILIALKSSIWRFFHLIISSLSSDSSP